MALPQRTKNDRAHYWAVGIWITLFVFLLFVSLWWIDGEEVVAWMGEDKVGMVAFVVAFFGGLSAGGAGIYVVTLGELIEGGVNPVWLGLVSGLGLSLGDVLIYALFYWGLRSLRGRAEEWLGRIELMIERYFHRRPWAIPLVTYLVLGWTPLPNDIILAAFALTRYPFLRGCIVVVLGSMTYAMLLGLGIHYGFALVS